MTGLEVRDSGLPGAGKGLFTIKPNVDRKELAAEQLRYIAAPDKPGTDLLDRNFVTKTEFKEYMQSKGALGSESTEDLDTAFEDFVEWRGVQSAYVMNSEDIMLDARSTQSGVGRWMNMCRAEDKARAEQNNSNSSTATMDTEALAPLCNCSITIAIAAPVAIM